MQTDASRPAAKGCLTCGWLSLLICGGLTAVGVVTQTIPLAVIFGVLSVFALGGLCFAALKVQQQTMIDFTVSVERPKIRFAEPFRVTVMLQAKKSCPLTTGQITLRCREKAINRGGTQDTTYYHFAHIDQRAIEINDTLAPGMPWTTTVDFQIPEGLPASFSGRNNFIQWQVYLELGIKGPLLDIRHEQPITVVGESA